jgi:hypothetical protein
VFQRSKGENTPIPRVYQHWLNFMILCDHSEFGTQNHSIGMEENDSVEEEWKKYTSRSLCCYSSLWYSFLYVSYPTHLPVSMNSFYPYFQSPLLLYHPLSFPQRSIFQRFPIISFRIIVRRWIVWRENLMTPYIYSTAYELGCIRSGLTLSKETDL